MAFINRAARFSARRAGRWISPAPWKISSRAASTFSSPSAETARSAAPTISTRRRAARPRAVRRRRAEDDRQRRRLRLAHVRLFQRGRRSGRVLDCAHTEARSVPGGIGLVKLMGRHAGFITAGATVASQDVNFALIPEVPFKLDAFLAALKAADAQRNRTPSSRSRKAPGRICSKPSSERARRLRQCEAQGHRPIPAREDRGVISRPRESRW